jgi:hypothetical protein
MWCPVDRARDLIDNRSMRRFILGATLGALAVVSGVAAAKDDKKKADPSVTPSAGASQEIIVEGTGGGYAVTVSPTFVTVFYIHGEKIGKAIASDQKRFTVSYLGDDAVAVRPAADAPIGTQANLAIETANLKINVVLTVGEPSEAVSQVLFVRREEKERFEKRVAEEVEKRVAPIKAEYERREKELEQSVNAKAETEIAERMLRRFEARSLKGIERSDDNVVFRVERAVIVGDDVYVYANVQNRNDKPYPLKAVAITQEGHEIPGRVVAEFKASGKETEKLVGSVPPGRRGNVIVVLPLAKLTPGRDIEVEFQRGGGGKPVRVDDLRVY